MTAAPTPSFPSMPGSLGIDAVRRNWAWFLLLGVALIVLGMIAISMSFVATMASVLILGWLLIFAGAAHLVHAFGTQTWRAMLWHIFEGLLALGVGVWLLVAPESSAKALTLMLGIFLVISGVLELFGALTTALPNRAWVILSSIASIVLGGMVLSEWPYSGLWFIGLMVGIGMIFRGWMWVMLATMVRGAPRTAA